MKNKFNLNALRPGDRIVLPKSKFNLIQHHAIYIGKDNNGCRIYIENANDYGVQIVNESYLFRDGCLYNRIEPFEGNEKQRYSAIQFAYKLIGAKYDLINFNCEHYANLVQNRNSGSKQVVNGFLVAVFFIATLIVISD